MLKSYNVITFDINRREFVPFDVMPYFLREYVEQRGSKNFIMPQTRDEFKKFVEVWGMYQFWGRCEYEVILVDWPCQKKEKKIDVWEQIKMNIDTVTDTLMENVARLPKTKAAAKKFIERNL